MQLVIHPDGSMQCLYGEAIDLTALGALKIVRASHVEPDKAGNWRADLRPVGGPCLGPYPLRSQALAVEEMWLIEHWLSLPPE